MSRKLKIAGIVTLLIIVLLVGYIAIATHEWNKDEIRALADAIKVPDSWQLTEEQTTGYLMICIDGKCPYASRAWKIDRPYSSAELAGIFEESGVRISFDRTCGLIDNPNISNKSICSGKTVKGDFRYSVYEDIDADSGVYSVAMFIQRR